MVRRGWPIIVADPALLPGPGDRPLGAGRVIAAALAAGAVSPDDVVNRGVLVEVVGRSHPVYRVSIAARPAFYLKAFGPRRGASDGLPARETAVLALAAERPEVAALVPSAWPWPDAATLDLVATAAFDGREAWTLEQAGGGALATGEAWARIVAALVPPLAAFHRSTRDLARPGASPHLALAPELPWGLTVMDGDAPPEIWDTPALAGLLREAAADPALVAGLRAARALWRPLALIHADLKHDNILVREGPGGLDVRVIDWEMARIGDPAWDLAGIALRLPLLAAGPPWPDEDLARAAALVTAYAAASGLGARGLAERLILFSGALLLSTAVQFASTLPPGADLAEARTLVMKARSIVRRSAGLTTALTTLATAL